MANATSIVDSHANEWSAVQWALHVCSWLVLLALFVAIEFWGNPVLASFILSLKLGWRDLAVAIRVRRHNDPALARAMPLFYLAHGCFKVALGTIGLGAILLACEMLFGMAPQLDRVLVGLPMIVCTLMFGELFVLFAAAYACRDRVAVWLDGTIYKRSWTSNGLGCHGTLNRAPLILAMGMLLVTITFLAGPVFAVIGILWGNPLGIPGGIVFTVFWVWTVRPMYAAYQTAARAPDECWNPGQNALVRYRRQCDV